MKKVNAVKDGVVATVIEGTKAPREQTAKQAYKQLVTRQGVDPNRAKSLLGILSGVAF